MPVHHINSSPHPYYSIDTTVDFTKIEKKAAKKFSRKKPEVFEYIKSLYGNLEFKSDPRTYIDKIIPQNKTEKKTLSFFKKCFKKYTL